MKYEMKPFKNYIDNQIDDILVRKVAAIKVRGWVNLVQKSKFPGIHDDVVLSFLPPLIASPRGWQIKETGSLVMAVRGAGFGKFEFLHIRNPQNLNFSVGDYVELIGAEIGVARGNKSCFWKTKKMADLLCLDAGHQLWKHLSQNGGPSPCHFVQIDQIRVIYKSKKERKMGSQMGGNFTNGASAIGALGSSVAQNAMKKARERESENTKTKTNPPPDILKKARDSK